MIKLVFFRAGDVHIIHDSVQRNLFDQSLCFYLGATPRRSDSPEAMKTKIQMLLFSLLFCTPASKAEPAHRLTGITLITNQTVVLTAEGSVAATNVFRNYFDLVPVQASGDLGSWTTVNTMLRTNLTTNSISLSDPLSSSGRFQFFRAASNQWHTPLRKPTGPFAVGTTTRLVTDSSRTNRFGYKTNSSFMLTFWYPTARQIDATPAPYMHSVLASNKTYWSSFITRIPSFVSHAIADAPMSDGAGQPFPVIIYSHGLATDSGRGVRTENTGRCLELTSHGFIVVSLDHNDTFGTVFPGDNLVLGKATDAFANELWSHTNRLRDIDFVIGQLSEMNTNDPILANRLDLTRIGMMGWSFGGGVAADSLRVNEKISASALLDGYLSARADLKKLGVQKPVLAMCSPTSGGYDEGLALFNKTTKDSYLLQIKNSAHEDFTDAEWLISPSDNSRRRAVAMDDCAVSFFKKYLQNSDDHLLDNPSATYAEVISFKKN